MACDSSRGPRRPRVARGARREAGRRHARHPNKRESRTDGEPAVGRRRRLHLAAKERSALAHTDEAVATGLDPGRPLTSSIAHDHLDSIGRVADLDVGASAARVLDHVRQRLLKDPCGLLAYLVERLWAGRELPPEDLASVDRSSRSSGSSTCSPCTSTWKPDAARAVTAPWLGADCAGCRRAEERARGRREGPYADAWFTGRPVEAGRRWRGHRWAPAVHGLDETPSAPTSAARSAACRRCRSCALALRVGLLGGAWTIVRTVWPHAPSAAAGGLSLG